ncbi:MAG: sigma-70 family RNA polymerase sigma factor [Treponema sp.]|nr:sigma-70 family RNA polymerase sigma factor [Treponema sp.]
MDTIENPPKKAIIIVHKKRKLKSLDSILAQNPTKKTKTENFEDTNSSLYNPIFNKTKVLKEDLIKANKSLVYKYANHFYKHYRNRISALDIEDLVSAGTLGLLKAIEKFDPKLENSFSTYAVFWITQAIRREIDDNLGMAKIPVHFIEKINKYNSGYNDYLSVQEIKQIQLVNFHFGNYHSLDDFTGSEELDTCLKDLTSSYNHFTPTNIALYYKTEYQAEKDEFATRVKDVLESRVKPRYLNIFMLRYGLEDGMPKSLEEVGDENGITRERVRQICEKCLGKLRQSKQFTLEDYSTFEVLYD